MAAFTYIGRWQMPRGFAAGKATIVTIATRRGTYLVMIKGRD
jgi:hypothetical protein